jgi:copper(I)-binding protein
MISRTRFRRTFTVCLTVVTSTMVIALGACKRHASRLASDTHSATAPTLHWSRAYIVTPAGNAPAVLYVTIQNPTAKADTLLRVTTPLVDVAMLHANTTSGSMNEPQGTMSMVEVSTIEIPSDTTIALAPGGTHVMLMNPKHAIARGDSIPVTLVFTHAGALSGNAAVIAYTDVDTATAAHADSTSATGAPTVPR